MKSRTNLTLRTLLYSMAFHLVISATWTQAGITEIIKDVSGMDKGDWDKVNETATAQAQDGAGLGYRSTDGEDQKTFSGSYTPPELPEDKKGKYVYGLAIFSDDGCDVKLNDESIHSQANKGQALPKLEQSLHLLPVLLTPGKEVILEVKYTNVYYVDNKNSAAPDIDGCSLFVFLLPFEVTKIWSDQFPGSDANQLSDKPISSHDGSGKKGHNYILVGGRNPGNQVYIKAKIDLPNDSNLKSKFKFALARMSGDFPFIKGPSSTINQDEEVALETSEIDTVSYSSNESPEDYAVVGGFDADGNGLANSEVGYISKYRIRPVSFSSYDGNRAWLYALVIGGWAVDRPYSAAFLEAFRTGSPISGVGATTVSETMSTSDEDHPDHHVGISFNSSNSGPISHSVWGQYSMLAYDIAASEAVASRIWICLASSAVKSEVQGYAWQPSEIQKTFIWPLDPTQDNVLLAFTEDDLHTSFGNAWFNNAIIKVTVEKNTLTAISVIVQGEVIDLYDWNYDEGFETDRRAATVQAGYNTLGPGGWIFRLEVDIDTPSPLPSPSYNFN